MVGSAAGGDFFLRAFVRSFHLQQVLCAAQRQAPDGAEVAVILSVSQF